MAEIVLLGALVTLGPTFSLVAARPGRVSKLRGHIAQALQTNFPTPSAAIKLRGELGFYTALLAGKLGRGVMGPLIARQYRHRRRTLCTGIKRNLLWRYSALGRLPPREIPFRFDTTIGAHTDAQGLGCIAAVYTGSTKTTVSTRLLRRFVLAVTSIPDESPISTYELCASMLMAGAATEWSRDRQRTFFLCVDNQAALAALVKGSSSAELGTLLASLFWPCVARGNTLWRIEYVRAKSDDADAPSLDCTVSPDKAWKLGSGVVPDSFRESIESREALRREATFARGK